VKVFISWSGERSRVIASALKSWLPLVIQDLDPWMSESDINKGTRWFADVSDQLQQASVGIICLTPENIDEPWILFEAGALSKTIQKTFVCPYLFQLKPADLKGPLAQFQVTQSEKDDTRRLLNTLNEALEKKLPSKVIEESFDVFWPKFEKTLEAIPSKPEIKKTKREDREILEEILLLVRSISSPKPQESSLSRVVPRGLPKTEPRTLTGTGYIGGKALTISLEELTKYLEDAKKSISTSEPTD
jgi:hypothetical protein